MEFSVTRDCITATYYRTYNEERWQNLMAEDAKLVERCLSGDIQAFEGLIERHRSLISAVTYNVTGNLSQSEDLAQETFITAWRNLRNIRDLNKFSQWLCGIARNLALNHQRQAIRKSAETIPDFETGDMVCSSSITPREKAISREEEEILWRELQKIPEMYREPMILYYRLDRSLQEVSEALGLSEDVVKQRLARGRKILQEQMALFVETALERTRPLTGFSAAILSSIASSVPEPASTSIITSVFKTSLIEKALSFLVSLPVLSWLTGAVIGLYLNIRWQWRAVQSKKEKKVIAIAAFLLFGIFFLSHLSSLAVFQWAFFLPLDSLLLLIISISIILLILIYFWGRWMHTSRKTIREKEGLPPIINPCLGDDGKPIYPRLVMALGLFLTNAGALLVPFLPLAIQAGDTTGILVSVTLYSLISVCCLAWLFHSPHQYPWLLSATCPVNLALALLLIDMRWDIWITAPGMGVYLSSRSWWLLNLFLLGLFCYAALDFVRMKRVGFYGAKKVEKKTSPDREINW